MNEKNEKKEYEDALPTQAVNAAPKLFENTISSTTELMIVSFYLPERANPIIINGAKTITIGRRDPKRSINPSIDLTEDEGAKHGVSRMHAELNFVDGQYHVKDTGSANGTWVNETKLQPHQSHPIQSGDQFRVGQMAIIVHITLPQRTTSDSIATLIEDKIRSDRYSYKYAENSDKILVKDDALVPSGLHSISVYLEQVSQIYNVVRQAQEETDSRFQVTSIHTQASSTALIVEVSEGSDVMNFLARKLPAFIKIQENNTGNNEQQLLSLQRYSEPMQQIADYALQELVFKFLTDDMRDVYVRNLASYFNTLLETKLEIEKL